jgi:uncharacterized protein involved in type VI secretion and phage assembly
MSADSLENSILRTIERYGAGRRNQRAALVTSWDGKKHKAKVMFQPEGHETGWIPVHSMAAGNGHGHMTGLTPGDGITTGDQVLVNYQEGDFETGSIVARLHSKIDMPPVVLAGEQLFSTPTTVGSSIKMAGDGSITSTDKGGSIVKQDGAGNVAISSTKKLTADMSDTSHVSVPTNKILYIGGDGSTGTYDFVMTAGGVASINIKVRIS